MTIYKPKQWGVAIYNGKQQTGAAVGVTVAVAIGRALTVYEARILRKHGFVPIFTQ